MKERETSEIEPSVWELLMSEPEVVAWLGDDESEDDQAAAAA